MFLFKKVFDNLIINDDQAFYTKVTVLYLYIKTWKSKMLSQTLLAFLDRAVVTGSTDLEGGSRVAHPVNSNQQRVE